MQYIKYDKAIILKKKKKMRKKKKKRKKKKIKTKVCNFCTLERVQGDSSIGDQALSALPRPFFGPS